MAIATLEQDGDKWYCLCETCGWESERVPKIAQADKDGVVHLKTKH